MSRSIACKTISVHKPKGVLTMMKESKDKGMKSSKTTIKNLTVKEDQADKVKGGFAGPPAL
jgi:hypothetical protein